ncbi:MAG TPA: T9SS C-terminal target domain-containing protein, partial [Balneolaceae bacterium]|nr:T9SS C-terminal target domain-containing protein [Balneolaceae bacterium]
EQEAAEYTIENIFSKESNPNYGRDWKPSPELYAVSNTKENSTVPERYELKQNYPNPFNPVTNITYSIPQSGQVKIAVFDMLGKKVVTLTNEIQSAGDHTVTFDASSLSSGVYLYRIETDNFVGMNKMTLIK